ncbi:protein translocase subunit SecF [Rhodothalassium salexigens]|uniref:protein translocase subunit SecF n=1 Tax=Rhodothalassium salexigens TaxID=1086 RepID=UPI001913C0CE|nr:protein translocase subunit SecF [Rhodothalassium salexigens]MBK5911762.1 protein translocase subunit SecF [Rhodothalassium salexigens]
MLLKLIPADTHVNFLKARYVAYVLSALLIAASMALFFTRGLNLGIDFKGGITIEVGAEQPIDIAAMRAVVNDQDVGDASIQAFGSANEALIRIARQPGEAEAQQAAVDRVKSALDDRFDNLEWRRTEVVGPKISEELFRDGIMAMSLAVIAVLVYIWFRFEWQFGLGAVIALVHDVLLTIGFFSLTGLEFNLSIVAAILTIIGYSLNDTVVVYDRIRETIRRFRKMEMVELLNLSLNQTLSRTLMTSLTTLLALFALFFFGGAVIQGFTAAMIWGVFVGTYSSIFVAAPVLLVLKVKRENLLPDEAKSSAP